MFSTYTYKDTDYTLLYTVTYQFSFSLGIPKWQTSHSSVWERSSTATWMIKLYTKQPAKTGQGHPCQRSPVIPRIEPKNTVSSADIGKKKEEMAAERDEMRVVQSTLVGWAWGRSSTMLHQSHREGRAKINFMGSLCRGRGGDTGHVQVRGLPERSPGQNSGWLNAPTLHWH